MKKLLISMVFALTTFNSFAMPKTTIEKFYFATSAKQIVVGYYYQGCTASAHVSWGSRTSHSKSADGLPPMDCTSLGNIGARGECILSGILDKKREFQDNYLIGLDHEGEEFELTFQDVSDLNSSCY